MAVKDILKHMGPRWIHLLGAVVALLSAVISFGLTSYFKEDPVREDAPGKHLYFERMFAKGYAPIAWDPKDADLNNSLPLWWGVLIGGLIVVTFGTMYVILGDTVHKYRSTKNNFQSNFRDSF